MKVHITLDIDGTERQQDAHLDELATCKTESEVVHINTAGGSIPAVITHIEGS